MLYALLQAYEEDKKPIFFPQKRYLIRVTTLCIQVLDKIQDPFLEVTDLLQGHMDGKKVLGEYENDEWLGVSRYDEIDSADKELQVSYHGIQKGFAEAIAEEGNALEKSKRFLY